MAGPVARRRTAAGSAIMLGIGACRQQLPALGGRSGEVWHGVARLLPRTGAEQMQMQGVEPAAVTDKEEELIGMSGDPAGNDGRDARKDLLEGIGVGGQYISGGLVGPEAVTCFDVTDDQSIEAAEVAFDEPGLAMQRRLEALGDDGRRGVRTHERACHNASDWNLSEALRRRLGLGDAGG